MIRDPSYGTVRETSFAPGLDRGMDGDNGAPAKSADRNKVSHCAVHGQCGQSPSVESGQVIDAGMSELERKYIEQTCVKILREGDNPEPAADPKEEQDRLWLLLVQAAKN